MSYEEKLQACYLQCCIELRDADVPIQQPSVIRLTNIGKTALGRYYFPYNSNIREIQINPVCMQDERLLHDVIVHELVHTIRGCQNHGENFKRWGRIVTSRTGTPVSRCTRLSDYIGKEKADAAIGFKYQVICESCGKTLGRYLRAGKVVKHPDWYHCAHCGGKLRIEEI